MTRIILGLAVMMFVSSMATNDCQADSAADAHTNVHENCGKPARNMFDDGETDTMSAIQRTAKQIPQPSQQEATIKMKIVNKFRAAKPLIPHSVTMQYEKFASMLEQPVNKENDGAGMQWKNCSTDNVTANAVAVFNESLGIPATWAEAKQRQLTICLSAYDRSLCTIVVEELHSDAPSGTTAFAPNRAFCEESLDLNDVALIQQGDDYGYADAALIQGGRRLLTGRGRQLTGRGGSNTGKSNICTALYVAGRLPAEVWEGDRQFGAALRASRLGRLVLRGYDLWSRPLAQAMLQSPLLLDIMEPLGSSWAKSVAWLKGSNHPEAQPQALAILITIIGVPICFTLGLMCEWNPFVAFLIVALCLGVARRSRVKGT